MSKKYTHTQSLLSAINLLYVAGKDVHVRPSSTILLTDKRFKIVFFNRYRMTEFPIGCGGKDVTNKRRAPAVLFKSNHEINVRR